MNKKQIIITLILLVALGAVFESFKKVNFQSKSGDGGINALLSDLDMKPFAQNFRGEGKLGKTQKVARRARRKQRPAINEPMQTLEQMADNQNEQFSFNENPDGQKVAENTKGKNKKKEGEEGDESEEDKDGDENAENQEGEESAEEQEVAELEDQLEDETPEKDANNEDDNTTADNEPFPGGAPVIPTTEEKEPTPLNELLAEWADELLKFPDYKLMNEFIALKQTGQIPDEVFYPIITLMLEDSREPMKVLGAHGLGATPSARSFEMIVATKADAPFGSRLSEELTKHIQLYANIQYISALRDILYSSEYIDAIRTAAELVDQAALNYLSESSTPPDGDIVALEQSRRQQQSIFQGFVSILDSLAQSSSDQGVVTAASSALEHITENLPAENDDVNVVSNQ